MPYATHYGTFKICPIRQSEGKLRFYGSIHIHKLYDHDDCEKRVNYLNIENQCQIIHDKNVICFLTLLEDSQQ